MSLSSPTTAHWPIIGHDWAVAQLQRAFDHQRARHAYLLQGPRAIGKTTLAKAIAMCFNCTGQPRPCGECRACRLIQEGKHPDVQMIEAERVGGTLKIDQIRDLQKRLAMRPYEGRFRVAILRRFQEAQAAAQNAILKTLEEPAGNVVLILTVEEPSAILPTIYSRCQIFNLRPLSIVQTSTALRHHWQASETQARALAHLSGGRIGWAIRALNDESELESRGQILDTLQEALTQTRLQRFALAEKLADDKSKLLEMLDFWQIFWRDVLLLASGSQAHLVNIDRETAMLSLAQTIGLDKTEAALQATRTAITQLNANGNTRLILEVLFLDYPFL
jgi:DNA polymerase-3 subunit delta'